MAVAAEQLVSPTTKEYQLAGTAMEDYTELIRRIRDEKVDPPQTAQEATDRLVAARNLYEHLPAPAVDMPDSKPRTLKELLADREAQYWLDCGEVREHGEVAQRIGIDTDTKDSMYRLISNLIDDVSNDVLMWGVAKTVMAGKFMKEIRNAAPFENIDKTISINELVGTVGREDLASIMNGRARILIKDGMPTIVRHTSVTTGQALGREIERRHLGWEARHKVLTRSGKLRKVVPFLADLTSVRSGNQLIDALQFNVVHHSVNHPTQRPEPPEKYWQNSKPPRQKHRIGRFVASQFEDLLG